LQDQNRVVWDVTVQLLLTGYMEGSMVLLTLYMGGPGLKHDDSR
jgi:hypothetical protein